MYIEPPKGFLRKDKKDSVLRLLKSVYGLKQTPKSFFDKISEGFIERGLEQSKLDKRLFMKKDMLCVIYVDDTILAGLDDTSLEEAIKSLGVAEEEQHHTFELRDEGEVGDFLGIRIEKTGSKRFNLTHNGLINKVLKEANVESCNNTKTHIALTP